jgi:hypothetical protein
MDPVCTSCRLNRLATEWERDVNLCVKCADAFGVMPMRPARRPRAPCGKCNGMRFIRSIPRELAAKGQREVASPMAVTYQHEVEPGWMVDTPLPIDPRKSHGQLEMYICRRCGFIEWYCSDPEHIPIGPAYMTEAIDYDTPAPYR